MDSTTTLQTSTSVIFPLVQRTGVGHSGRYAYWSTVRSLALPSLTRSYSPGESTPLSGGGSSRAVNAIHSFTVSPRPITSYGALDLPTYFLDLTPFAPTFADGLPHNVTLDVASAEANHTLNQNWYVSGLLQVVTDPSGKPTTGGITSYDVQPYAVTETLASIGGTDVNITVKAQRSLYIEAVVISGSGQETSVAFQQNLDYTNTQYYLNNTNTQVSGRRGDFFRKVVEPVFRPECCPSLFGICLVHPQRCSDSDGQL